MTDQTAMAVAMSVSVFVHMSVMVVMMAMSMAMAVSSCRDSSFLLQLLDSSRVQFTRVNARSLLTGVGQGLDDSLKVLLCAFW